MKFLNTVLPVALMVVLTARADFSPTNLLGLVLWLDASEVNLGGNPVDGAPVAGWSDKSGAGHDASQTVSIYQPHYATNGITRADGQVVPVVRFDGDWVAGGSLRVEPGAVHAFVVSQRSSTQLGGATYQRLLSTSDGNDGYDWQTPDWTLTSPYDGSGNSLAYDPDVQVFVAFDSVNIANLCIGKDAATGGSRFKGDVAEVLIFTNQISGVELTQLLNYLDEKWIEGVLPDSNTNSVGVQNIASKSAELTTTLEPDNGHLSICWDLVDQGTNLSSWSQSYSESNLTAGASILLVLTDLEPQQTYRYRFRTEDLDAGLISWSPAYFFTTRGPAGAIRWDAWIGDLGWEAAPDFFPGLEVERNLSPSYYHDRLPFYGEELSSTQILARATSQAVMDKEIAFARAAGLDFWAYVLYDDSTPLALARQLHQSSLHKMDINFCAIHEGGRVGAGGLAAWPDKMQRYLDFFNEPNYQTVLNGRPLLFVLSPGSMVGTNGFSSYAEAAGAFEQLRTAVTDEGLPTPYLVAMDFNAATAAANSTQLGFDAISNYAPSGNPAGAAPYSSLRGIAENWWDIAEGTGVKVIPPVTSGWDRRPRIENPVSWEPWQLPGVGISNYYERPTPQQLGAHVQAARAWCAGNASAAEADALIIYAWNEMDEGGWIVPSLQEKATHLEAIQMALNAVPDSDEDNMPDLWETWYFDAPANASPSTDYDLDGSLDFYEYGAGTDPVDPSSIFSLSDYSLAADSTVTLSWWSVAGRTYAVQFRTRLDEGGWNTLTNNLLATAPQNAVTLDIQTTNGFYRITVD